MTLQGYTSNFPDADLVDTNIKDGVDIFGVTGTFEGSWSGSLGTRDLLNWTQWWYNRSIQYKQIWNLYIIWSMYAAPQLWVTNPLSSDSATREAIKTLLWKTTVDSYLESEVWSFSQHNAWIKSWSNRIQPWWWPGMILVAMTLS